LLLRFPDDPGRRRDRLRTVAPAISYGGCRAASSALIVAYSSEGLRTLELENRHIASFLVTFQDGMAAPWRARALGDSGADRPEAWAPSLRPVRTEREPAATPVSAST
jgi:hypothetical protein